MLYCPDQREQSALELCPGIIGWGTQRNNVMDAERCRAAGCNDGSSIYVSDDRKPSDWIKALNKEPMPWVQVIDESADQAQTARVNDLYGNKLLPSYVLLDKEGKVILSSLDDKIIRKKIEELFH